MERELRAARGPNIAGMDEVGRGPLAGPVVACAVIMPGDVRVIPGVDDSKQLEAAERVRLAARIRTRALALGIGAASVREIDRLNIYHATVLAMRRALARLAIHPDHVLVDGKAIRTLGVEHTAIVGGDGCCYSIACASIVAKVTRDRVMRALAARHPQYNWERNVGYGTPAHLAGIAAHGVSRHHRRSFVPVQQLGLPFDVAPVADVAPELLVAAEPGVEELAQLVADAETPPSAAELARLDAVLPPEETRGRTLVCDTDPGDSGGDHHDGPDLPR